jgi:hypothetical protein
VKKYYVLHNVTLYGGPGYGFTVRYTGKNNVEYEMCICESEKMARKICKALNESEGG